MARVQVVGLGRVGLPLAIQAARAAHEVLGVDVDERVLEFLSRKEPPFREPGLEEALQTVDFSISKEPGLAEVHILALPTPLGPGGAADLSAVKEAAASLAPLLRAEDLVVIESTCPPGTTEEMAHTLRNACPDVRVACATERVLPGRTFEELERLSRLVGGVDAPSAEAVRAFYRTLSRSEVAVTDARTAEVVKLVENAYRDVNIAFANEVESLCRELGLDAREVIGLANKHPRVSILEPGPGVGGHCLPVDPWFLVDRRRAGDLIRTARQVNDGRVAEMVSRVLTETRPEERIVCLGLTYKPGVDDLRQAPALAIVDRLRARRPGLVRAVDPYAVGRHPLAEADLWDAVRWADVVVALVAHPEFRELDSSRLTGKRTLDLCGLWLDSAHVD